MAEEKKDIQNGTENNMKVAVTIIVILVAMLAVAIFMLQQKNNEKSATTGSNNTADTSGTSGSQQTESSEAGALGKNEVKLTDANFAAEVENSKGVYLVDFYLATCPHCKNVAKSVTAVSDELVGKAKVGKLDSKENNTTATKYDIGGVPTFIVFKDGKQVEKVEGEQTKQQLLDMVNKYLK